MVSNGLVNTVGVNLTHRPINRFTFSGRRITFFAPAHLVDSCSSQAVEFSAAITRCSRVHIQIVTVGASKMGDIFSLPTTDTLRAFFFHCIIHNIYIYIYIAGYWLNEKSVCQWSWRPGIQSQVESYQKLKKRYLMMPCLRLSIIR